MQNLQKQQIKSPDIKKKKQIKSQNNYVLSNGIIRLKKASLSIASQIKDNDGIHHNTCGWKLRLEIKRLIPMSIQLITCAVIIISPLANPFNKYNLQLKSESPAAPLPAGCEEAPQDVQKGPEFHL